MRNAGQFWLAALVLICAVVFGGGTHIGFPGEVIVQILAIFLLAVSVWTWLSHHKHQPPLNILLFGIGLLLLATIALQLMPLPPAIWKTLHPSLNGLSSDASSLSANDWRSLSLVPSMTWAVSLSLLAPVAVFMAVLQLDHHSRQRLTGLVVLLGTISLIIGLIQVSQGADSALRFYDITNPTEAVGFFANRNHFAALLYVTLVFSAVWLTTLSSSPDRRHMLNSHKILWFVVAAVLLIALTAGLAAARSRAGVVLAVVALFGVAAMMWKSARTGENGKLPGKKEKSSSGRLALVILVFATLFAIQFGLHKTLPRFERGIGDDLRTAFSQTTIETAAHTMPFGAGLGSFVQVYGVSEKQKDLFGGYGNRAHNDFAEFLLEAGLPGAVIMALFATWFFWRGAAIWFGETRHADRQILLLQRAASITVLLLFAHSIVDYPLRTTAMATVFAFSCAVMHPFAKLPQPNNHSTPASQRKPIPVTQSNQSNLILREQFERDMKWPKAWLENDDEQRNEI